MTTAGFAEVDITPPLGCVLAGYGARERPASGVRDPLFARAMVLGDDGARLAIVGADLLQVDAELVSTVRAGVERACSIPPDAVLVCASHTHFGPALQRTGYLPEHLDEAISPAYVNDLAAKLTDCVAQADSRRQPVRVGVGCGWSPTTSYNRRPLDASGRCRMAYTTEPEVASWAAAEGARQAVKALSLAGVAPTPLKPSPPPAESDAAGFRWGPTDPQVPVLLAKGQDGALLGGLVSFACHPVCGAGDEAFYDISADYPGALQQALVQTMRCPIVFALGCAGNQVPFVRGPGSRDAVGRALAAEVRLVAARTAFETEVPLAAVRRSVLLPLKDFSALEPPASDDAQSRHHRHLIGKYAGRAALETEVQALRLGSMALVSLPGEVFVEIGHAIKRRSPFPLTVPVSMGNDSGDYIPIPEAYDQGGYEPEWSPVSREAAGVLTEAALAALKAIA